MTVTAAPSILDTFNARYLSPQEVARTFVPPAQFETLINQAHTLVVGPRGSGKTTLLKMLHPLALENWIHSKAAEFRERINFTGVFIPADLNWCKQVESLGEGRVDTAAQRIFQQAAFTTHILHSTMESMLCRVGRGAPETSAPHRRVILTAEAENYFVREISHAWKLERTLPTLEGLRHSLARRLSEIQIIASREASRQIDGRNERLAEIEFLHIDFLSALALAIEIFNDKVRESGARWAMLFDELELVPAWIRQQLIEYLRSVDERFLFKLSLSPYCEDLHVQTDNIHKASLRHDYQEIRLWYVHKETGYSFCRDLLSRMLNDENLPKVKPESIFGRSIFSTDPNEWSPFGTAYRKGSSIANRFVRLAHKDPTFKEYLEDKGVDCWNLESVVADKRAADIRKVTSIVALRDYFRSEDKDSTNQYKQTRRSRKIPKIYAGATSLFAMVEGNPRWFIGIVGRLLRGLNQGSSRVDDSQQVKEVLEAANVFRAMLKTIPCAPVGGSRRGLLSLLDPIGEFFAEAAIDEPFDPEPPCSFGVDSRCSDSMIRALGSALNAGAIVYAPEQDDPGVLESLRGKRFRLSYLLAPYYHFPLMLGRKISLNKILESAGEPISPEPTLFSLFDKSNE